MNNVITLQTNVDSLQKAKSAVSDCIDLLDTVGHVDGVFEIDMKLRDLYVEICDKLEVVDK